MNSLVELRDFFKEKEILVTEFSGWSLKVGKDLWTLCDGIFYRNGAPQSLKDKEFMKQYTKVKQNVRNQSSQTRKWRGISSRNYRGK
jgi:hypothetical protein